MFKLLQKVPYWQLIAVPLLLLFIGAASNQAVLIANGDKFPVLINQEQIVQACTPAVDKSPFDSMPLVTPSVDINTCANGGEFLDDSHVIMTSKSHLNILADIFDFHDATYSIGDLLMMLGSWMRGWSFVAWVVLVIRKFLE